MVRLKTCHTQKVGPGKGVNSWLPKLFPTLTVAKWSRYSIGPLQVHYHHYNARALCGHVCLGAGTGTSFTCAKTDAGLPKVIRV